MRLSPLALLVFGCSSGRATLPETGADCGGDTGETADTGAADTSETAETDTAETGETADTGETSDTSETAETDTGTPCEGVTASTADLYVVQGGASQPETLTGCASPLVVDCVEFVSVTGAPSTLDGSVTIYIAGLRGYALPASGTCTDGSGAVLFTVHMES